VVYREALDPMLCMSMRIIPYPGHRGGQGSVFVILDYYRVTTSYELRGHSLMIPGGRGHSQIVPRGVVNDSAHLDITVKTL
jgi:hypothetical protein